MKKELLKTIIKELIHLILLNSLLMKTNQLCKVGIYKIKKILLLLFKKLKRNLVIERYLFKVYPDSNGFELQIDKLINKQNLYKIFATSDNNNIVLINNFIKVNNIKMHPTIRYDKIRIYFYGFLIFSILSEHIENKSDINKFITSKIAEVGILVKKVEEILL